MKNKNPLLFIIPMLIIVLAIMYFAGVFSSADVKRKTVERDEAAKTVDTLEVKRDSTMEAISQTSTQSVTEAETLTKTKMPNEKYNTPGDTTGDYMFSKITAE